MNGWFTVAIYNPAILRTRRDPNVATSAAGHLQIAMDILQGLHVGPAPIEISKPRYPRPDDPTTAGTDIETYGSCRRAPDGYRFPRQTVFHPIRSLHQDKVPFSRQIVSVGFTVCKGDHPSNLEPVEHFCFYWHLASHRAMVRAWFRHLKILCTQNGPFDLSYLRIAGGLSSILNPETHSILELACLNYLHCEIRLERGLKPLSQILGTHRYEEEDGDFENNRFPSPMKPRHDGQTLAAYQGADTYATVADIRKLADLIEADYPGTLKLSDWTLSKYSDLVWNCLGYTEVGQAYNVRTLLSIESKLRASIERYETEAESEHGLILSGTGSQDSRYGFIDRCLSVADNTRLSETGIEPGSPEADSWLSKNTTLNDPRLERTDKAKKVSYGDTNRNFLLTLLPKDHKLAEGLRLFTKHGRASKVLGSFIYPLLYHQRAKIKNQRSSVLPRLPEPSPEIEARQEAALVGKKKLPVEPFVKKHMRRIKRYRGPKIGITYPTWYPVPSADEGNPDEGGGTEQCRITAKNHSVQTDPPEIQDAYASRFPLGLCVGADLSQIEYRVAGLVSGEPSIIRAYTDDRDLHWERAEEVFGIPFLTEKFGEGYRSDGAAKSMYRQPSKTFNFGDLFLAQAKTLQLSVLKMTGILLDIEVCQRVVDGRPRVRPVLCRWQEDMIERACRDKLIELPLTGNSRLFIGSAQVIRQTYAPTIVNFPIQATAALILQEIEREIRKRLPLWDSPKAWAIPTMNKYDAVYFDVRRRHHVPRLHRLFDDCVREVEQRGLWARLCDHYGNYLPLRYEMNAPGFDPMEDIDSGDAR